MFTKKFPSLVLSFSLLIKFLVDYESRYLLTVNLVSAFWFDPLIIEEIEEQKSRPDSCSHFAFRDPSPFFLIRDRDYNWVSQGLALRLSVLPSSALVMQLEWGRSCLFILKESVFEIGEDRKVRSVESQKRNGSEIIAETLAWYNQRSRNNSH